MSNFKVIKLDGRHSGHDNFDYVIDFNVGAGISWANRTANFLDGRIWFWNTFGPGVELVISKNFQFAVDNYNWAWTYSTESTNRRVKIFVKDETTLSHFLLVHSN
jgi:hypothetical protein